jgi:hypothetical protein
MPDDDAVAHVTAVFGKGAIGIFSFDQTKPGCGGDPTEMTAEVFTACTENAGLPTRVTRNLDEFDPSRPLENVFVVRPLALDGTLRWFGVVGLGPGDQYRDALAALDARATTFGEPVATPGATLLAPRCLPICAAPALALLDGPAIYGAVLGVGAAAVAVAQNPSATAAGLRHLIDRTATLLRSTTQTDVDQCEEALTPTADGRIRTVCDGMTTAENTAMQALANFWAVPRWWNLPLKVCPFDAAYFARSGAPPGSSSPTDLLKGGAYFQAGLVNGGPLIAWNRDSWGEPHVSSFSIPHEFGHYLQYMNGLPGGDQAEELQATCLGGVFAGANRVAGFVALSSTLYGCSILLGDRSMGFKGFGSDALHGTCDQQRAAFAQGYEAAIGNAAKACSGTKSTVTWALNEACNRVAF